MQVQQVVPVQLKQGLLNLSLLRLKKSTGTRYSNKTVLGQRFGHGQGFLDLQSSDRKNAHVLWACLLA